MVRVWRRQFRQHARLGATTRGVTGGDIRGHDSVEKLQILIAALGESDRYDDEQ